METFKALNSCVFLHEPSTPSVRSQTDHPPPTTILFFAWLGALPRHFSKYIAYYTNRYPNARILVIINGNSDIIYRSNVTQEKRLEPALQVILADTNLDGGGRLLTHAFSNGGSNALANLLVAFHRRTGKQMPLQALILDSAPGRANLKPLAEAMRMSMPKQTYLRLPMLIFVLSLLGVMWVVHRALRLENKIDRLRRLLNDPQLSPLDAQRCYVYSKSDKLVKWEDVEEHADDAERRGYHVRREKFDGSEHVSHMKMDKVKYWSAIERFWNSSSAKDQQSKENLKKRDFNEEMDRNGSFE